MKKSIDAVGTTCSAEGSFLSPSNSVHTTIEEVDASMRVLAALGTGGFLPEWLLLLFLLPHFLRMLAPCRLDPSAGLHLADILTVLLPGKSIVLTSTLCSYNIKLGTFDLLLSAVNLSVSCC